MSRAFVKEPDGDQVGDELPEIPVSKHPNYVTAAGLQQLKDKHTDLVERKNKLTAGEDSMLNKTVLAQIERELRYFSARINSAILVSNKNRNKDLVAIGSTVTFVDEAKKQYRFTIVGEDEASLKDGKISWVSPLAKALLGKTRGEKVVWKRPIGDIMVEIKEIGFS